MQTSVFSILIINYQKKKGREQSYLQSHLPATEWNTNTAEWFKSLYFNTCFLQLLNFISLAQQPTGQAAKHYDSETIQCAGAGRDNFTLAYLLQLRLCLGEFPYQLRIRFVPRSVPFEESEKHPCVQAMFFSHGNKQDF